MPFHHRTRDCLVSATRPAGRKLFGVRVGAEHFDEAALLAEQRDGFGHFAVANVAVAIHEEEIFPGFPLAGARLDFRHVDAVSAERRERAV